MKRVNNTLYDIIDSQTGENFNYDKVTTYADGSTMNDAKCDGVIYRKLGSEYFKRNFTGAVNVKWFGATYENGLDLAIVKILSIYNSVVISLDGGKFKLNTNTDLTVGKKITIIDGEIDSYASLTRVSTSPQDSGIYAKYPITFSNITFNSLAGTSSIFINLGWQDSTAGINVKESCVFNVSNGSIGINLGRCFSSVIQGNYNMKDTSVGLLIGVNSEPGVDIPTGPMNFTVTNANFNDGLAIATLHNGGLYNSFEGFVLNNSIFYDSKVKLSHYNTFSSNGNKFINSETTIEGACYLTSFTNTTFDNNQPGSNMLKLVRKFGDISQTNISNCSFAYFGISANGIIFSDDDLVNGYQITNVTILNNLFVGSSNDIYNRIDAIVFNDITVGNVIITGSNYLALYSCISFQKKITRSTIELFEARDVSKYADGLTDEIAFDNFNRFDSLKLYFDLEIIIPTYLYSVATEPVFIQNITFSRMQRAPIASLVNLEETIPLFSLATGDTYENKVSVNLIKNNLAPGGTRGGAKGRLILDSTSYIAPR